MSRPSDTSDTYFYNQKSERTFHRRLRKAFDDYTLFGEHKEQLLTFKGVGVDEDKGSAGSKPKRPQSSLKRVVVSLSAGLPSIDPSGPRLVSEAEEGSERIREDEEEEAAEDIAAEEAEPRGKGQRKRSRGRGRLLYTFAEAKFASTSVLAGLARLLEGNSEVLTLPAYLVDDLLRDHDRLTCDAVVERREWQTETCFYPDSNNASPYLTGHPEDEATRLRQQSSVEAVLRSQSSRLRQPVEPKRRKKKRRTKGNGSGEVPRKTSIMDPNYCPPRRPERPTTALSVASNYSVKSDVSRASSSQHRDESPGHYEYDSLPTELRGTSPTILNYRREVQAVVPKPTRLEKLKMMKGNNLKPKRSHKISVGAGEKAEERDSNENIREEPSDMSNASVKHVPSGGTLCFSISTCENEEWVVPPSEEADMEASTLHQWDGQLLRLKEAMRKREEAQLTARLRGEDGPVIVKFYDPKSLRSKHHQRASSFPLPAVLGKLPPSVASFSLPTVNETLMMGEGANLFLLILPDGSGHCNYFSGREAISISRREQDRRGLHTIAYDDTEHHRMLASFGPHGRNCCYHPSGSILMLSSEHGGSLFDEDGNVTRNWKWPDTKYKLPVSISIQLNSCLSFHCTGLSNMVLRFSCHGQMNRFDVAPILDIIEGLQQKAASNPGVGPSGGLLYSKSSSNELHSSIQGTSDGSLGGRSYDEAIKELTTNREKIRLVVNNWMAHYRQTIGITAPSPSRPITSQTHLTQSKTMFGYLPGDISEGGLSRVSTRNGHAHHHTHPLSPSTSSALGMRTKSPTGEGEDGEEEEGGERAISPTIPRPVSPLDYIQSPPEPQAHKKASPVKASQTGRPKKIVCGCPVALHALLLKGLDVMPPCKCDKRKAPNICDLEFDVFLQSHVPRDQLVIVVVHSSVLKDSCPFQPMLDDIHYSMNRLRYSPCVQCSTDPFRLFKYDLAKATKNLTYTIPLLMQRHSVSSGMCLMYVGGRLVCADTMFNGYGTTRGDFMKQIRHSIDAGRKGMFLPHDYKFATTKTGSKHISSKLWAYPVTGVMEDLIPLTPSSHSETNLPAIAGVQEPPRPSKHGPPSTGIFQISSFTSASKFSNLSESVISVTTEDIM